MQIIVVDDEPLMLKRLKQCIEEAESACQLFAFSSSQEAFAFAREHKVDVCFLDINMPGMDGVTLAKVIIWDTILWG